jgi:diguanylate cyclase (GGDEF)-like protein
LIWQHQVSLRFIKRTWWVGSFEQLNDDGKTTGIKLGNKKTIDKFKKCLEANRMVMDENERGEMVLLYPLYTARNNPLGVINITCEANNLEMQQVTLMLLQIYKNFMALINDNERDTLTGLLNRKTFENKMNHTINGRSKSFQHGEPVKNEYYLAIFDIDHFKRINDTFGHMVGDEVLLIFARIMAESFTAEDMLFRFGGEEFVVVCQRNHATEMEMVLNKFRSAVEAYLFPQVGKVTVSSGFTQIQLFDVSPNIIDRADAALYYAKQHGRNRVCSYDTLVAAGELAVKETQGEVEMF